MESSWALCRLFSASLAGNSFCSELSMLLGSRCYPEQDNDLVIDPGWPDPGRALSKCLRRTHSFPSIFVNRLETQVPGETPSGWDRVYMGSCVHGIVHAYLALPFGLSQLIIHRMEFLVGHCGMCL